MARTKLEKIAGIEEEIRQLENQRKQLIQQQKEQERKERTHRLCKRGGLLESILPDTVTLTDEQFKIFLEGVLFSDTTRRILDHLTAQTIVMPIAESVRIEQDGGANGDTGPGISQNLQAHPYY